MGDTISVSIVAFACVVGTICHDVADFPIRRDLAEQGRQNRCIANVTPGDLNRPDLDRFLDNPELDIVPDATFLASMLPGV